MIGGGPGAFIGPIHRIAAELDREIELVAGAFSSDPARSRAGAEIYGLDVDRCYADYRSMIEAETARDDGAELVSIVAPNHLHFPAAQAALEAGLHVMSDKPATATLEEAERLADIVETSGCRYALTYAYSGYPLVREARELCRDGSIGAIRKVVVEYSQGWLATAIEADNKQAAWRTDPSKAGVGGCVGDIGVHAFHLAEFVSGLRVAEMCPDLGAVVGGRVLDDDCNILLHFAGGARGVLHASQIAFGERNNLNIRVYGEQGSLAWRQEDPNRLHVLRDGTEVVLHAGDDRLGGAARRATRLPPGHPEGYLEAFANLYTDFARDVRGGMGDTGPSLVPGIGEGLRGMRFVDQAVRASAARTGWVKLQDQGIVGA